VCARKLMDMEDNARPAKICLVYALFLDRGIDAPDSWAWRFSPSGTSGPSYNVTNQQGGPTKLFG
jgi:hypothetical protein